MTVDGKVVLEVEAETRGVAHRLRRVAEAEDRTLLLASAGIHHQTISLKASRG